MAESTDRTQDVFDLDIQVITHTPQSDDDRQRATTTGGCTIEPYCER